MFDDLAHSEAAELCGLRLEHYGHGMNCRLYDGERVVFDGHMCDSWIFMQTLKAAADKVCQDCRGTGVRDTGGFYSWGEPIRLPCDCSCRARTCLTGDQQ